MIRGALLGLALALALAGCGKDSETSVSNRTLPAPQRELAESFAKAVAARDYDAVWEMMAENYKSALGREEFMQSITRYRDRAEEKLSYKVRAGDDPKEIQDDALAQILVSDVKERARIIGEAILDFDIPDAEGWVIVIWIVEDAGRLRVLNYYQDD